MAREEPDVEATQLYNGLARPLLVLGVPVIPLMIMSIGVVGVAMNFGGRWAALWPCFWAVMAVMTKSDVNAFRVLGIGLRTKMRNRNKAFWKASSYTPRRNFKR